MIAGIDGGGTSTKLELRDDSNQVLRRLAFGPFNVSAIGIDGVKKVIAEMAQAVQLSQISRLCIGGAGSSYAGLKQLLLDTMGGYGFAGSLSLCTDCEIALRGAIDGPGAIIIAGTGSVGYGRDAKGNAVRVGGWGHLIDDPGSGYAIGRDALTAAVRTLDGRMDAHLLTKTVLGQIGEKDAHGILNYVYYSGRDKSATAAIARCVLDCAAADDSDSLEILAGNADELVLIAKALARGLAEDKPKISLLGGLLANDTIYGRITRERMQDVCTLTEPVHDALWGAAQLAWEMDA